MIASLSACARRHGFFIVVFAAGAVLRAAVQVAYVPAILYFDSHLYLDNADELDPTGLRPIGYEALVLRWLLPFHDLALVPLVQHLLGLAIGVAVYALLVRRGVRTWLAAVAAAPVLLDGYQLQIEQNVMSDTVFLALLVAGLALLLWRPEPSPAAAFAAGLAFGLAATVRLVGLALLVGAVGYAALAARGRLRRGSAAGLVAVGFLVPLVAYGAWYHHVAGEFRLAGGPTKGKVLYGRTAPLADCDRLAGGDVPAYLVRMCPNQPRYAELRREWYPRYWGPDYFANWGSPAHQIDYPAGVDKYRAMERFGWQVISNQPWGVAAAVGRDFAKGFAPVRATFPGDTPLERWRFQRGYPDFPRRDEAATVAAYGGAETAARPGMAAFLRDYQSVAYTSGLVFAAGYLAALAAAAGLGRSRRSGLRLAGLLVAATGLSLLLLAATFEFSWRYQLPSIVLAPLAGAFGATALFARRREPARILLSRDDGTGASGNGGGTADHAPRDVRAAGRASRPAGGGADGSAGPSGVPRSGSPRTG